MFRKHWFSIILILVFFMSLTGCSGLQRKFSRKKRKEERPTPVITTYDYAKDLRVEELYKKHFLYWKTWHNELIDRIDGAYKKRVECYDNALMHLEEMQKYLGESKALEIKPFTEKIKAIDPDIRKKKLSKGKKLKMLRMLEMTKRQVGKRFSYPNVKDNLELKK